MCPCSRGGLGRRRRRRLLPKQCHVTGFSLFITVFIGLGAAGLVLEGGFGAAKPRVAPCRSIAHGCWAAGWGAAPGWKGASHRAQSCPEGAPGGVRALPLGTATAYGPCGLGGLGRRAELQGQACQKHQDPQESFIGDSEAAGQNTTFLTSSSRAGGPGTPGEPLGRSSDIHTCTCLYIQTATSRGSVQQGYGWDRVPGPEVLGSEGRDTPRVGGSTRRSVGQAKPKPAAAAATPSEGKRREGNARRCPKPTAQCLVLGQRRAPPSPVCSSPWRRHGSVAGGPWCGRGHRSHPAWGSRDGQGLLGLHLVREHTWWQGQRSAGGSCGTGTGTQRVGTASSPASTPVPRARAPRFVLAAGADLPPGWSWPCAARHESWSLPGGRGQGQ